MRSWILSFSLGIFTSGFIPLLPDVATVFLFLIPGLLCFRFKQLQLAAAFSLGIFWLLLWAHFHVKTIIPAALEQQDLWVEGVVRGLPLKQEGMSRFTLHASKVCENQSYTYCLQMKEGGYTTKLLLSDYSDTAFVPGQHWLLQVRLKRPNGFANPGSFNYERWLFQQKIGATGYVHPQAEKHLLGVKRQWFTLPDTDLLRYKVQQSLKQIPLEQRGFITALMIGDRAEIGEDQWALLTHTGTNHLMVISGLHIGMVTWLIFRVCTFGFSLFPELSLLLPVSRLAAVASLFAALFYAALAGFSLPVQRALVMVSCLMSGLLFMRQVSPTNNLCIALFLVLLRDPLSPQSTGFWLSFGAASVLVFFYTREQKENGLTILAKIKALIRCQGFLFFGMFPLMLLFFGQVSLLAPLINLAAIPFIGLVVVPLCLLYLSTVLAGTGDFSLLISFPDFLLSVFSNVLSMIHASTGFLLLHFPSLPLWCLGLISAAIFLQIIRPGINMAFAGLLIIGASFFYRPDRPHSGEFIIDVLDVGQGLAIVITTREHVLIYDTGPVFSPRFNAGSGIVQPFLKKQNLGIPDVIVVSHGDNDHEGGLNALYRAFPSSQLITGEKPENKMFRTIPCLSGQHWIWDEVKFEFLYPFDSSTAGNNASCVLKITSGPYSALLPGDIEQAGELALLKQSRDRLAADILIAPHHGSMTSSTGPFIRTIDPEYTVFTTGYLNRFNHPHPDIQARYQRYHSHILNTATSGAIRFHVSETGLSAPESYRFSHPGLWHF